MQLGYNTDVFCGKEPYHVQTEGHVQSNPRIETLIYCRGIILRRLSIKDPSLAASGKGYEETTTKIRQQHLMAVSLVERGEIRKLATLERALRKTDPFDLLADETAHFVRELWKKGPPALGKALLDLGREKIQGSANLGPMEEKLSSDLVAETIDLLGDDEIPFYRKQSLVSSLLQADAAVLLFDRLVEMEAEQQASHPPLGELKRFLAGAAQQLIETLFLQSRKGSQLADELLLSIFTRQSRDLVKFLFEKAERRFVGEGREHRNILPMVLLLLEDRFLKSPLPKSEVAEILDRLNQIYSSLDLDTLQEIGEEVAKLRKETDRPAPFTREQMVTIHLYKSRLDETLREVKSRATLPDKLSVIARRRQEILTWERLLLLHVDLRIALKEYQAECSTIFLHRSRSIAAELCDVLSLRPSRGGRILLDRLDAAVAEPERRGRIVQLAIRAEAFLAILKEHDIHRSLPRPELRKEMERISRLQHKGTAVILKELSRVKMGRSDQLKVVLRLLSGARLKAEIKEELLYLAMTRYPAEVLSSLALRLRDAGGPAPLRILSSLEKVIAEGDGGFLRHGGESGFDPEFELGFEAAALSRLVFPGQTDAAELLDGAMRAAGFHFSEILTEEIKAAYLFCFRLPTKKGGKIPPPKSAIPQRSSETVRKALKSFEREIRGISATLEIQVRHIGRAGEELARVQAAVDGLKEKYRPLIAANRRLAQKLRSFERVVKSISDPLKRASERALVKGQEVAPLILSQMTSDDSRRDLIDLLSRLFLHELTTGIGNYGKLRESLVQVLTDALPESPEEWNVLDLPKLQYLLFAKNLSNSHVALVLALIRVNNRFFLSLKPRKAYRCRLEPIRRAVETGLF